MKKELLFVDGYNIIGAWPHLVSLQRRDELALARDVLLNELSEYAKYHNIEIRVVFDAMFVPGIEKQYDYHNLIVVFTKEDETADMYIERAVGEENLYTTNVVVATSDLVEQWLIFQRGASRKSANDLYKELQYTKKNIQSDTKNYHLKHRKKRGSLSDEQANILRQYLWELTKK